MSNSTRRTFMLSVVATGSAIAASRVFAQANKVAETDPQAVALGYKEDSTKVDMKKYPKHAATDNCKGCQLFQGKAGDAYGACPLYAGKVVAATGWCSAWVKKA